MADLISRAAALDAIDGMKPTQGNMEQLAMKALCWAAVKSIPTVDAAPVVHGRWVISPGCSWPIGDCSVCGEQHIGTNSAKYCPNCGAKMDLETDH